MCVLVYPFTESLITVRDANRALKISSRNCDISRIIKSRASRLQSYYHHHKTANHITKERRKNRQENPRIPHRQRDSTRKPLQSSVQKLTSARDSKRGLRSGQPGLVSRLPSGGAPTNYELREGVRIRRKVKQGKNPILQNKRARTSYANRGPRRRSRCTGKRPRPPRKTGARSPPAERLGFWSGVAGVGVFETEEEAGWWEQRNRAWKSRRRE